MINIDPQNNLQTDLNHPILLRTSPPDIAEQCLNSGSIWLHSLQYHKQSEDADRSDTSEGSNMTRIRVPIRFQEAGHPTIILRGDGRVGTSIDPNIYIFCLHGTAILDCQRLVFGGHTIGIKNVWELVLNILSEASKQVKVTGFRDGSVFYQYPKLCLSKDHKHGGIMNSGETKLVTTDSDVLRKEPIQPFISQDEYRIAIFVKQYLRNDPNEPLKIQVDPKNFFDYLKS